MARIDHRGLNYPYSALRHNASSTARPGGSLGTSAHSHDRSIPLYDTTNQIAFAYNQAGRDYSAYADGNSDDLFEFDGIHAYADRCVWARLDAELINLREGGATSVSILDAGCGPGTWLRRLVLRARELGFTGIEARGFDIAREQIRRARFLTRDMSQLPGVQLRFDTADLNTRFPEEDGSVDITLCLYSVLSHLPVNRMESIAAEIARVTRGTFVTTVRPLGSRPTAFVDSVDKALWFQHDAKTDQFEIAMSDGQHFTLNVHLFSAAELEGLFSTYFKINEISGLDLFHARFAPDSRWNPASFRMKDTFNEHLERLEEIFAPDPSFLEYATHLLLVGTRRNMSSNVSLA